VTLSLRDTPPKGLVDILVIGRPPKGPVDLLVIISPPNGPVDLFVFVFLVEGKKLPADRASEGLSSL